MILDSTTKVIRAYLSGPPATTNPDWNSSWADHNTTTHAFSPGHLNGALNGATPVVIQAAPSAGYQRQTKHLAIFNLDSANVTVTVEIYDGATARKWYKALLKPSWSLEWEQGGTWHVYDENGVLQGTGGGVAGITYVTVREADLAPSVQATIVEFDQVAGLTVTDQGGGVARVTSAATPAASGYRRWAWMFGVRRSIGG